MTLRRLLPEDCLVASNVLKELSINQDVLRAKRRLNMQLINQKRLGRNQSMIFSKLILKTLKNNKLKGGFDMTGRLIGNPVLASNKRTRDAFNRMVAVQKINEKRLRNL